MIPLDGSKRAEQILRPASDLGSLFSSDYRLVRIVRPQLARDWDEAVERQAEAKAYLAQVWRTIPNAKSAKDWNTRAVIMPDVASYILKYAHRRDDIVALTTRGLGGAQRLFLGSVADKLVRGPTGPVLVRRPIEES